MIKKIDIDAFLKSVLATSPLKSSNTIKKNIIKNTHIKEIKKKESEKFNFNSTEKKTLNKVSGTFKIEKINIKKKLKKGSLKIDKRIDFHGFTLFEAEELFFFTIKDCYLKNLRCLLFITGKGILKKNNETNNMEKLYYGKIRNSFISWVKNTKIEKYILGFEQAGITHGADGAFFVYLRKKIF